MKRFLFILIAISCLLSLCNKAHSQKWISFDKSVKGDAVSIQTIKSDTTNHIVKFTIHGIYDNVLFNRDGEFHQLSIGKQGYLSEIGSPKLPLLSQLIAIPEGADLSVSIKEEKWTDINIGQICPSQKPLLEEEMMDDFYIDKKKYKQAYIPHLVQIGKEMEWRGVRNVKVSICPFKYYPEKNLLSVLSEFVLQVTFQKGKLPLKDKQVYETVDLFNLFDNDIFNFNSNGHKTLKNRNGISTCPNGSMLIIIGSGLSQLEDCENMKKFRKWKAFKGFRTYVVSTAITGTTPEAIKNCIQGYYNNYNVRYVLFVGDNNHIPMKEVDSPYDDINDPLRTVLSDYWYGCMGGDNDYEADIAIGRFSVTNTVDFENIVNKTIKYEKSHPAKNRILLVSHFEGADEHSTISYQNCCNSILNEHYKDSMVFVTAYGALHSYGGDEATNDSVISKINQGANIINYRGHAGVDYWGSKQVEGDTIWNYNREIFRSTEINNINSETCAIFFCVACNTGNIANSDCMLETFTRASKGAVAFLGATRNSYTIPNHTFNLYLFDQLLNHDVYHIGDMNVSAHIRNISTTSQTTMAQDDALCYLLGGDPTLEIWTAAAQIINDVDIQMVNNQVYFSASVNDSVYVSVVHEDETHLQNTICFGNNGYFLKPYFNFYFAVNSHNWYPHIVYCNLTSNVIENTIFDYDGYSYVTPLTIRGGFANNDEDAIVKVKNGSKLIIQNGTDGVTINDSFECEQGAVFEIKQ